MVDYIYRSVLGIPMDTNCAPLIEEIFLYCYERDFMSDIHKSKRHDLIDMFNDTSRTFVEIWWYFVPRIYVERNLSPGLLRWSS